MRQIKQLDFTGEKIFVGIDVHKKSWRVSIRSRYMELRTFSQSPSVEELTAHLKQNYPSAQYEVVYEAGFCGFSYQRKFNKEGINCIVVHPADVPTNDKDKARKSDTVDCRKLSQTLSSGDLKGIFVPGVEQQDDRSIIRAYRQLVKDQTRTKNRIKSWLHFQGITIPETDEQKHWSNNFTSWLKAIELSPSARISLNLLIQQYEQTRKMVLEATKQLRALSTEERHKENIRLLRTIPGIGQIAALLFVTEIGDIERFRGLNPLCDYIGLVPRTSSSSDRERVMGLTHRGNRKLRETLIEASWVAIRLDPALTMAFNQLCKRMKKNKAIIRIARKMLSRIRFVMKNKEEYETAIVE